MACRVVVITGFQMRFDIFRMKSELRHVQFVVGQAAVPPFGGRIETVSARDGQGTGPAAGHTYGRRASLWGTPEYVAPPPPGPSMLLTRAGNRQTGQGGQL